MGRGVPLNQIILGVSTSRSLGVCQGAGVEASRSRSGLRWGRGSATPATQYQEKARSIGNNEGGARGTGLRLILICVMSSLGWITNLIPTLRHLRISSRTTNPVSEAQKNVYELDNDVAQGIRVYGDDDDWGRFFGESGDASVKTPAPFALRPNKAYHLN